MLFGGIIYFEDKTHYYVAALKEDEYYDSPDNVRDILKFDKITRRKHDDCICPVF